MGIDYSPLVISALKNPEKTIDFSLSQWDLLIRQARRAGVLARLGYLLEHQKNIQSKVPLPVLMHIQSAQIYANQVRRSIDWELLCIQKALDSVGLPLILLKGAAYVVAHDDVGLGRLFSDIDILVPKKELNRVERALINEGWKPGDIDVFDQRYYRKWMHELPPMQHVQRHTSIDVHHNLLPLTNRFCPDADKLLSKIVKIPEKNVWVLALEDRVIHSATHLFHEGELEHGFRDLSDLDLFFKEFSRQEDFWNKLLQRAEELKQQISLYYAFRYTNKIFQTSIPKKIFNHAKLYRPNRVKEALMDFLFLRALMPDHPSCNDRWTGLARWLLYIRSHYLRMPLYLLIPHLFRKSWMRLSGKSTH